MLDLVVVGLVWLATALVPALTMDFTQLGWWIGHEVELDGILLVGIAVAIDLARAAQSRPLAGDLRGADLVAAEDDRVAGRSPSAPLERLAHFLRQREDRLVQLLDARTLRNELFVLLLLFLDHLVLLI